jgi:hypothetical protein
MGDKPTSTAGEDGAAILPREGRWFVGMGGGSALERLWGYMYMGLRPRLTYLSILFVSCPKDKVGYLVYSAQFWLQPLIPLAV